MEAQAEVQNARYEPLCLITKMLVTDGLRNRNVTAVAT